MILPRIALSICVWTWGTLTSQLEWVKSALYCVWVSQNIQNVSGEHKLGVIATRHDLTA